MEKITYVQDLLVHELQSLDCSEEQLQKALTKLMKKSKHSSLKNLIKHHASLLEDHREKSKEIIQTIGKPKPFINTCSGIQGLIDELMSALENDTDERAKDIHIITSLQKIGSYKICGYNNAKVYTSLLNLRKQEKLLQKIVDEERDERELLNELMHAVLPKQERQLRESILDNAPLKEDKASEHIQSLSDDTTETIQSPGGRAGTSHRSYGRGESRGH